METIPISTEIVFKHSPFSNLWIPVYTDDGTVTLVSYHYNINKPLSGVQAGDYAADVNSPQGLLIY